MQDEALRPISLVGNSGVLSECAGAPRLHAGAHRSTAPPGEKVGDRDLIGTETNPTASGFVSVWCSTLPLKRGEHQPCAREPRRIGAQSDSSIMFDVERLHPSLDRVVQSTPHGRHDRRRPLARGRANPAAVGSPRSSGARLVTAD